MVMDDRYIGDLGDIVTREELEAQFLESLHDVGLHPDDQPDLAGQFEDFVNRRLEDGVIQTMS